jgi:hypothetical protein
MSTVRVSSRGLPGFQTNSQMSSGPQFRLYYKPFDGDQLASHNLFLLWS